MGQLTIPSCSDIDSSGEGGDIVGKSDAQWAVLRIVSRGGILQRRQDYYLHAQLVETQTRNGTDVADALVA